MFGFKDRNEIEEGIKEIKEKFKQGVAENELFLFSILTGRIEVAKCWWKKGKVRPFISSINFNF